MNYSLFITTRYRVAYLSNLLQSIYNNTKFKDLVEIHVIYDTDDTQTEEFVKNYTVEPPIKVYFHKRERSENLVDDYHNYYSKNYANGKYVIFINDDTVFEMNCWDEKALEKLQNYEKIYPDGLVYGLTEDYEKEPRRNIHNWFSCFPLITKKHIELLGYAFDPEFKRDGADWALAATYRNFNRILDLRTDIIIRHLSYRSGRRPRDKIDEEAHQIPQSGHDIYKFVERNSNILIEYIRQFNPIL